MSTIIKDKAKYNALVARGIKHAGAMRTIIDSVLRSSVWHVWKHGDPTKLNAFLDATDDVVSGNAHRKWLLDFASAVMTWDSKAEAFKPRDQKVRDIVIEDDLVKAIDAAPTYYVHTPAQKFQPFNVMAAVHAIITKAERIKSQHDAGEISPEDWAKVDLRGLELVRRIDGKAGDDAATSNAKSAGENTAEPANTEPKRRSKRPVTGVATSGGMEHAVQ